MVTSPCVKVTTRVTTSADAVDANVKQTKTNTPQSPIAGKTVMFTGKFTQGTRPVAEKRARGLGATTRSSVSKKLDYLIIGTEPSNSKVLAAQKANVTVLTEAEYEALLAPKKKTSG